MVETLACMRGAVRKFVCALAGMSAMGCMGPLTTLETARALEPGQVRAIAGGSIPVHGTFGRALTENVTNAVRRASRDPDAPLTDEEIGDALEAALAGVLLQPTFVPELTARVGVLRGLDLGLRYGGSSFAFDAKYQFLATEDFDGAVSLGYATYTTGGARLAASVLTLFDFLRVADYSRQDVDAALLVNTRRVGVLEAYGALRYVFGRVNLEVALPSQVVDDDRLRSSPSAHLHYFLASGGLRVGNDRVGALLELTAGWLHFEPLLLGSRRDLSGPVAIPAAGLDVRF